MFTYSRTYILFLLLGLSSIPARPQSAFTYKTLVETGEVAPAPRAMGQILESSIDDHGLIVYGADNGLFYDSRGRQIRLASLASQRLAAGISPLRGRPA